MNKKNKTTKHHQTHIVIIRTQQNDTHNKYAFATNSYIMIYNIRWERRERLLRKKGNKKKKRKEKKKKRDENNISFSL
jgi:hypothetical protein